VLRARLNASPSTNLVCTAGGEVIAAAYMQRIEDDSALDGWTCKSTSFVHSSNGKFVHLIALIKDPAFNDTPIGSELRGFALHLARLDTTVEAMVVAVPRRVWCDGNVAEASSEDPLVAFHTAFGARVIRTLPGSVGCGCRADREKGDMEEEKEEEEPEEPEVSATAALLLLRYELRSPSTNLGRRCGPAGGDSDSTMGSGGGAAKCGSLAECVGIKHLLAEVFEGFGFKVGDEYADVLHANFFECSTIGSVEALQIRDKLCVALDTDLSATLLYDYPSILALSEYLCARTAATEQLQEGADDDGDTSMSASDSEEGDEAEEEEEEKWGRLSSQDVVRIQSEFTIALKESSVQDIFKAMARRCFPDKFKYSQAIASICDEVQAKILCKFGLIADMGGSSMLAGSNRLYHQVCKYWLEEPKLREAAEELIQVTWTGKEWPM